MSSDAATLVALAFDPRVEPPSDPVSERVLDAALELAAESGLRNLTMDDIAARARVGRMTVYRRFGDKARLVEALAVREARRCLARLDAAIKPDAPVGEQIADGFIAALRIAREHPLLNRLARTDPRALLTSLGAGGGELFALGRTFAAERLRAARRAGLVDVGEVDEVAELLLRVGLSFVLLQETVLPLDDDERLRDLILGIVAPLIGTAR